MYLRESRIFIHARKLRELSAAIMGKEFVTVGSWNVPVGGCFGDDEEYLSCRCWISFAS